LNAKQSPETLYFSPKYHDGAQGMLEANFRALGAWDDYVFLGGVGDLRYDTSGK
jgi:hypothetical protein